MSTGTKSDGAELTIDARFNGPETTANGGYACGRLAAFLTEPAEVTLRLPPPLEQRLTVAITVGGRRAELYDGDAVVADAKPVDRVEAEPPVKPSFAAAEDATARHAGRGQRHAMSDCFVCSPYRTEAGDGLGVCPGPLAEQPDVGAAPWIPDPSVAADGDAGLVDPAIVWATLDCSSYVPDMWLTPTVSVLGRMSVQRERDIAIGERLIGLGWALGAEGRKRFTASALVAAEGGEVVARARSTWIELRG
jgi:hypothetical protein